MIRRPKPICSNPLDFTVTVTVITRDARLRDLQSIFGIIYNKSIGLIKLPAPITDNSFLS